MSEPDAREFASQESHWFVRACRTPVSEILHGRIAAVLGDRGVIAEAGLPAPVSALVWQVVCESRLWRSERLDVARELIAHFADGLAAGRTPEQLVAEFGDAKQAARLIRKAKLRNRPLWWQTWHMALRSFLVVLVVGLVAYGGIAARFYLGEPRVAHNYVNEINEARRAPEADRAWPIYRTAGIQLGDSTSGPEIDWDAARPGMEGWDKIVALIDQNRASIELAREAAKKRRLGFLIGDPADFKAARDAKGTSTMLSRLGPLAADNPELITIMLQQCNVVRELSRLLVADAYLAATESAGDRVVEDLAAVISMADQLFEPPAMLVEQLVRVALFSSALDATGRIVADFPLVLSEAQLRDLAHRIAAYRSGARSIDFSVERMTFEDVLQRTYTDDGAGDGRITPAGLKLLDSYLSSHDSVFKQLAKGGGSSRVAAVAASAISPGMGAMIGSRRENRELYDSLTAAAIDSHRGPPWRWDLAKCDVVSQRLGGLMRNPINRLRYLPVFLLAPAMSSFHDVIEREAQLRDATEVAIALVLWQRRHGQWPTSLNELVPEFLPSVPPDRLDGQPLRYALRDGMPIVYSIGVDRDDDSGRAMKPVTYADPPIRFGKPTPQLQKMYQLTDYDGDWILWPPAE